MPNLVEITVRVDGDKAVADMAAVEEAVKASGKSAGSGFTSEFTNATSRGGGSGLLGALFGGSGSSIESDAERAGEQAGTGLGRGMETKFSSTLGSGLLSGLMGTSGGTKLFSSAGNTVVQDAAAQGEKIAQGISEGLESGLTAADAELSSSIGDVFAGAGGNVTTGVQVTGIKTAEEEIAELEASLHDLSDDTIAVKVTGISEAESSVETLKDDISSLSGANAAVGLNGADEDVAQLKALGDELDEIGAKHESPSVSLTGAGETVTEAEGVKTSLDGIGSSSKNTSAEAAGLGEQLGFLGQPMAAAIAAGVVLSPVLVTAGVGMAGFGAAAVEAAKPILAAATAAGGLQNNLQTLNPQQQEVARGLISLQAQFASFSKALQPEVFSAFDSGLSIAKTLLGDVEPVAKAAGGAIDSVLANLNSDFQGGEWKQFFTFMAQEAGPDIQQLGNLFIATANDLPPLLEELQPLATGLLQVATGAADLVGDLSALNPAIDNGSVAASKMHTSNNSLLGGFTSLIGSSKELIAQVTGIGNANGAAAGQIDSATGSTNAAVTAATDLSTNLTTLEAKYGLTASQAEQLVTAAGQTDTALEGSGTQAAAAEKAVEGYANANLAAQSPTTQLANDISTLNNNTLGATAQLTAFGDAWNVIVGNSVSDQQAVLQMSQAFQAYSSQVQQSGAQSLQAQTDFLSYVGSIDTNISTMQKSGASVGDVNSAFQTQISRLGTLHGLNGQEQSDVAGVTKAYDTWANSTAGLNSKLVTAANTVKDQFTANLKALGAYTPTVNTDVNNLANAVQKTGSTSSATSGDRKTLISDLEKAGDSASTAEGLVDGLIGAINKIPKSTSATITVNEVEKVTEQLTQAPAAQTAQQMMAATLSPLGHASGGYVSGAGGPHSDSIAAWLSNGEYVLSADAVQRYGLGFLDAINTQKLSAGGYTGGSQGAQGTPYGGVQTINLEIGANAQTATEQFLLKMIREFVRVQGGGNAQTAFGRH